MKVDHLFADINRTGRSILHHIKSELPVEAHHRVGVLHRQRHMIEASDASRLLRPRLRYEPGSHAAKEPTSKKSLSHAAPHSLQLNRNPPPHQRRRPLQTR
jgi:hypothetical protein